MQQIFRVIVISGTEIKMGLTRTALKRLAVIPRATSYSPLSLGLRVSWFSIDEQNIL